MNLAAHVEPFTIAVPEESLSDLRERLSRTRWTVAPAGPEWALGTSLRYMKHVVAHWLDNYSWRDTEARLNAHEQHRVTLDGMKIHVTIERGSGRNPMPVILTHGWPGSPVELISLSDRLAHPEKHGGKAEDAYTVVIPALPGCGFSDAPKEPISPREVGALWARLMRALGFERYMVHGGDWGGVISSWHALDFPDEVIALHCNNVMLDAPWSYEAAPADAEERAHAEQTAARQVGETGYQWVQGTKPLTAYYALTDSPAGLAAWILEKFHSWTPKSEDGFPPLDLDHLITNIMFYWLGNAQAVSWMYRWLLDYSAFVLPEGRKVEVPSGFCLFPDDVAPPPPDRRIARAYNCIHVTRAERGGHFPGLEHPDVLADDMLLFRRKLREAGRG
ncbi:epoxide hydrolase family protein [Rhizorhapis sp. SPR117]|uniref:epoxide hydrolase family protein n=1 Tax=Rhizorhapis sp. SPR117 TaxID=2912611 RepID=UPI001F29CC77|nr:epoxide hydrolase [Rhizorhapis sp. SPR117]